MEGLRIEELEETLELLPFSIRHLPIVIYDNGEERSGTSWKRHSDRFALREARSPERLLDQTLFFLHCGPSAMNAAARQMVENLHCSNRVLEGRKALIVDDDMRNIFALATVLEDHGMRHVWADNGRDAIRLVEADPEIDIVLMDIMMPEMDGLATMREIRKRPVGRTLPIIAVTAKAMKGDRERCIEAGAWDYLSKPVNREDLLAVLHAWLHR